MGLVSQLPRPWILPSSANVPANGSKGAIPLTITVSVCASIPSHFAPGVPDRQTP